MKKNAASIAFLLVVVVCSAGCSSGRLTRQAETTPECRQMEQRCAEARRVRLEMRKNMQHPPQNDRHLQYLDTECVEATVKCEQSGGKAN